MDVSIGAVKNSVLFSDIKRETRFYSSEEYNFEEIILENIEFMRRWNAEVNFDYKQPITYWVIVNSENKIFVYKRWGKWSNNWEKGVFNKISVGIWGHLDEMPEESNNVLLSGLKQEMSEEIGVTEKNIEKIKLLGYINNESNDMNKVHMGVAYVIHVKDNFTVKLLDWELEKGEFLSINEYDRLCHLKDYDIEPWSKLLFEPLHDLFLSKKLDRDLFWIKKKGFNIVDESKLKGYLHQVWIHRLRRYFNTVESYEWTDFQKIIDSYVFDKEIRFLNLQMIEMIETYLKNLFNLYLWNPLNQNIYKNRHSKKDEKNKLNKRLIYNEQKIIRLKYDDIECHDNYYNNWILSSNLFYDNLTFWELISIFYDLNRDYQYKIAWEFNIPLDNFKSWVSGLGYLRNLSSHWKNVFNKKMTKSLKGRKLVEVFWTDQNSSYISYFFILDIFATKINPDYKWKDKVFWKMEKYWITFTDFAWKKEIPHIEHESGDPEAWEILVSELYKKYL